ncbi:hypothetical protein IMZ31_24070 (plasmid) [Pontibacillus sp. ALD_SL1]|uniref:hypothetical protein n=1 Tax=Pontibacillus sp. ALD_SL1 TaxID=2777185 RepID=UPI001A959C27|nr:hypothetical protein [Pontibacillus sp. ALD_SL1]QST02530.1 hypothetical protein IMZ31_24070 [Pontibacillus sp. ALD_SL1]
MMNAMCEKQSKREHWITENLTEGSPLSFYEEYGEYPVVEMIVRAHHDVKDVALCLQEELKQKGFEKEHVEVVGWEETDEKEHEITFTFDLYAFNNEEHLKECLDAINEGITPFAW